MDRNRIQKYAKLVVNKGVNVQKGQILLINAGIDAVEMARACVEEAYLVGAKEVVVNYTDEHIMRSHFIHQDVETLTNVRDFQVASKLDYFKEGACILHLASRIPGIFNGLDAEKIGKHQFAYSKANKEVHEYTMLSKTQWCIAAVPNKEWACQVFPDMNETDAVESLWEAILNAVHVHADNDPLDVWTKRDVDFIARCKTLNDYDFEYVHFTNSKGTDLKVGLVENHIWCGGSELTPSQIRFNANMPTEEIFTMPKKDAVNGKVVASKPLLYNGELIEDFYFVFKDGRVVEFDAKKGKNALEQLVNFDDGSCYLGEVALVPHDSPISNSGILFLNTLFDENASCHLALGDAYPTCVKGGADMSEEQLKAAGANSSMTHDDFMFGTADMKIIGVCKDGTEVSIFENGNFVI